MLASPVGIRPPAFSSRAMQSLIVWGLGASILSLCAVEAEPPDSHFRLLRAKGQPLGRELQLFPPIAGLAEPRVRAKPGRIHRESRSTRANYDLFDTLVGVQYATSDGSSDVAV